MISDVVTWYYGFTDIEDSASWYVKLATFFSPKWARHCYCFCQIGNHVMIVEPCPEDIKINLHENISADDVALLLIEAGHTVIKSTHKSRYCRFAFIPSCVTIVKTVSGYRSNAITPYGLYKSLVKEIAHDEKT